MRPALVRLLLSSVFLLTVACAQGSTSTPADGRSTPASAVTPPAEGLSEAQVTEVIDGDTVKAAVNSLRYQFFGQIESVRLVGIDTPELNPPDGPVECYAREASAKTQELIDRVDGHIWLERDVSDRDRFGRLLRYVWLDRLEGKLLLNLELVRLGYAVVGNYAPDVEYQDALLAAQREAQQEKRGLWGACP